MHDKKWIATAFVKTIPTEHLHAETQVLPIYDHLPALHTIPCQRPPSHSSIAQPCHLPTRPPKHEKHSPDPSHPSCRTLHGGWHSPPNSYKETIRPLHNDAVIRAVYSLPDNAVLGQGPAAGGRRIPPPPSPVLTALHSPSSARVSIHPSTVSW